MTLHNLLHNIRKLSKSDRKHSYMDIVKLYIVLEEEKHTLRTSVGNLPLMRSILTSGMMVYMYGRRFED